MIESTDHKNGEVPGKTRDRAAPSRPNVANDARVEIQYGSDLENSIMPMERGTNERCLESGGRQGRSERLGQVDPSTRRS